MRTQARFPLVSPGTGYYESFYLKATAPGGGRAVWIRHTVHQPPHGPGNASTWFVLFGDGPPRAVKVTVPRQHLTVPDGGYVAVAGSRMGPTGMTGSVEAGGLAASWDLAFTDRAEPLRHLPAAWMYARGFPRTKLESPHPSVGVTGTLRVGDEEVRLDAWDGIVGHNWGREHAARWVWLQAPLDGGYVDIAAGRVGLGRRSTPWIANGGLALDGEVRALGGLAHLHTTRVDAVTGRCTFTLGGRGVRVRGEAVSALGDTVGWRYADPDGGEHQVTNSSIADLALTVERSGRRPVEIAVPRAAAYELGTREPQPTVAMQPFPDG